MAWNFWDTVYIPNIRVFVKLLSLIMIHYAQFKEYVFEHYVFYNMYVLNCMLLLESRLVDICCARKQIVSGPPHDWLQFPYHFVVPNVLLCSHCLLRSWSTLCRDHPQVVNTTQPERNQHVALQLCGYVLRMPVKCCGTGIRSICRGHGAF
jgi:hypothetical protein